MFCYKAIYNLGVCWFLLWGVGSRSLGRFSLLSGGITDWWSCRPLELGNGIHLSSLTLGSKVICQVLVKQGMRV